MASPRSMWSGNISMGMVSIPVSVAKAWSKEREPGLRDVCTCHSQPIDRSERCSVTQKDATGKQKGVEVSPGNFHVFEESEVAKIEDETGSDELVIEDYQKIWDLPLDHAIGTYYLRYAPPKAKSTTGRDAFANLVATLQRNDTGAVVKWCTGSNQRLCVMKAAEGDVLLLIEIPFVSELREAAEKEKAHLAERPDKAYLEMFHTLLSEIGSDKFDHNRFVNNGVLLRSNAVEKAMREHGGDEGGGEQQEQGGDEKQERKVPDLMAQLQASIAEQKISKQEKV